MVQGAGGALAAGGKTPSQTKTVNISFYLNYFSYPVQVRSQPITTKGGNIMLAGIVLQLGNRSIVRHAELPISSH